MTTQPRRQATQDPSPQRPYRNGQRIFYGSLWAIWTLLLVIVGANLLSGDAALSGLIAFALAVLTGRYSWRIWTWQARRLIFLIVF